MTEYLHNENNDNIFTPVGQMLEIVSGMETLRSIKIDNMRMISPNTFGAYQRALRLKSETGRTWYPLGRKHANTRRLLRNLDVEDQYYIHGTKIITKEEARVLESKGECVLRLTRTRGGTQTKTAKEKERLRSKSKHAKKKNARSGKPIVVTQAMRQLIERQPNRVQEPKIKVVRRQVPPQPVPPPLPVEGHLDEVQVRPPLELVVNPNPPPNPPPNPVPQPNPQPPPPPPPPEPPIPPVPRNWAFRPPERPPVGPVRPVLDLSMQSFEYEEHSRFLLFFTRRVTKTGYLPKAVISQLYPKICKMNSVELMSYENLLKNDEVYQRYNLYYLSSSVSESANFNIMCTNLWYSFAGRKATQGYKLSRANSKYSESRRLQSNNLAKRYNVTLDGLRTKLVLVGLGVATVFTLWAKRKSSQRLYNFENWGKPPTLWFPRLDSCLKYAGIRHTMIPMFPNFSLVLEEVIKCIPFFGWRFVSFIEYLINGNWKTSNWHKKSMKWSYLTRIRKHKLVNMPEQELKLAYRYFVETGVNTVYPSIVEELDDWSMPSRSLPKTSDNAPRPYATIQHPEHRLDFNEQQPWYSLMWGVSNLVKNGNSYENQYACISERVNAHNNTVTDEETKQKFIKLAVQVVLEHDDNPLFYAQLTGRQKVNMEQSREQIENGTVPETVQASIKGDELINGNDKSVPRFLCNLSGVDFYKMGKITSELTHWLATHSWNYLGEGTLTLGGLVSHPYLTCGSTSNLLDAFIKRALSADKGLWQLLMGDDTLLLNRYNNTVLENDFSRYDRTQNDFLLSVPNLVLLANGYDELVEFRKQQYLKPVVFKTHRKLRKPLPKLKTPSGEKPQMRMTGEAATCLDNSINNAFSTLIAIQAGGDITQEYARCGLVAKAIVTDTVMYSTFLKGVFLPDVNGDFRWVRLPSWICKFGKVLTDPFAVFKGTDKNEVARALLWAQFKGYGDMTNNWFYRRIAAHIERITGKPMVSAIELEKWQIEQTGATEDDGIVQSKVEISDEVWDTFMMKRYKVSREMMENYLDTLEQISPSSLPCIYGNDLLQIMLVRDY